MKFDMAIKKKFKKSRAKIALILPHTTVYICIFNYCIITFDLLDNYAYGLFEILQINVGYGPA